MLFMIIGEIGSGKSTVANILQEEYGFKEEMFAGPLKEFARLIGFTNSQIYGTQKEKLEINEFWNISGRVFLQKFGSDICRYTIPEKIPEMDMSDSTLWVRVMEKKIQKNPLLVISDGRFPDEATLIKKHGGIIIRIQRDSVDNSISEISNNIHTHVSETSMKHIKEDYLVDNNGTLDDLKKSIDVILHREDTSVPISKNYWFDKYYGFGTGGKVVLLTAGLFVYISMLVLIK
jgi:hypothetical protein